MSGRTAQWEKGLIIMQAEFESNQLEVVLVLCRRRVNEGGCIRVAACKNASWYRQFCGRHQSDRVRHNRAFDTKIKRRDVARILARLAAGLPSRSKYAPELLKIAQRVSEKEAA